MFFRIQNRVTKTVWCKFQRRTRYIVYYIHKIRDIAKCDAFFIICIWSMIYKIIMQYKENYSLNWMKYSSKNWFASQWMQEIAIISDDVISDTILNIRSNKHFTSQLCKLLTSRHLQNYFTQFLILPVIGDNNNFLLLNAFLQSVLWSNFDNGMFCVNTI